MITIDPPSTSPTIDPALFRSALVRFLRRARGAVGLSGTVSVLLTSDAELKRLNRTFRGKNRPTDILSFPATPIPGVPVDGAHQGDLAVSLETAARQAERFGHTLTAEVKVLLLHGLLHLAGFDHETDRGEMAAEELRLRIELRLPVSLIARAETPAPGRSRRPLPATVPAPRRPRSSQAHA